MVEDWIPAIPGKPRAVAGHGFVVVEGSGMVVRVSDVECLFLAARGMARENQDQRLFFVMLQASS